jgi:hypothetical protein
MNSLDTQRGVRAISTRLQFSNILLATIVLLISGTATGQICQDQECPSAPPWQHGYCLVKTKNFSPPEVKDGRDFAVSQGAVIAILEPGVMLGWVPQGSEGRFVGTHGILSVNRNPVSVSSLGFDTSSDPGQQALPAVNFFNAVAAGKLANPPTPQGGAEGIAGEDVFDGGVQGQAGVAAATSVPLDVMQGIGLATIIFVESNGTIDKNLYSWTQTDFQSIANQTLSAYSWWSSTASQHGKQLTFRAIYWWPTNTWFVTQGYEPILHAAGSGNSGDCLWVNPIMANLRHTETGSGCADTAKKRVTAFNLQQKTGNAVDWSFTDFVAYNPSPASKTFTSGLSAYSYRGGPYIQALFRSSYDDPSLHYLVATHETAHMFWACDEYPPCDLGNGQCSPCVGATRQILNGNCPTCNSNAVACIMNSVGAGQVICTYTVQQIGW